MKDLTQKEVELLKNIEKNKKLSQRDLAKLVGLSLGLVNLMIKKFVQDGYVQITRLNKKKVEYLLTARGTLENDLITYAYTGDVIRKFKSIEAKLIQMLQELYSSGHRHFTISGNGELRQLLESVFKTYLGNTASLDETHHNQPDAIILNLMSTPPEEEFSGKVISVFERIREQ